MATYGYFFPSGDSPLVFPALCNPWQFEIELDDAWSGAISFTLGYVVTGEGPSGIMCSGYVYVVTPSDLSAGDLTILNDTIEDHVPVVPYPWTLAVLPRTPAVGDQIYITDASREGGGTGCICFWDGTDWRRVSDNAVAS